ncbi:ABC transporter type 1, transmembrane domain-containing protein [Suillus plorans]|uniref:ABC transporter type 1, transmembrane domain-containing protein n=1 Tax=Suillus plorans TaxID=116603 RepID=A0A9P7DNB3_9AGAM|nr:ABC transporter type 1, transmembrane domain-containing protein [Suillus plorans]KAG1798973.1 ABC transporter type 1, transmembrane domain-containing protein [Suillus plorans]
MYESQASRRSLVVELFRRVSRIMPHLWPSHYPKLQFIASTHFFLLHSAHSSPHSTHASSGSLAAICDALWIPLMQYGDRSMSMLSFNLVLALSLSWHTKYKTGELLRILDRGTAINRVGELIGFTVVPALMDICVALVVFVFRFEPVLGALVGVMIRSYIWASAVLTRYGTRIWRRMNERDVVMRGIHTDCLLNYETIKYFGGEEYEAQRYTGGYPLYFPLSNLGGVYRTINQSLIDTKKLLHLLNESSEVVDEPDAKELIVTNSEVEFDNVSFSYDHQTSRANPYPGELGLSQYQYSVVWATPNARSEDHVRHAWLVQAAGKHDGWPDKNL